MHIPELQGALCPATFALATAGVTAASALAIKSKKKPSLQLFASASALIFVGQMLNYPILAIDGVSGHVLGGTLAVCLLGPAFAVLAMALVVGVQCLAMGDGGLTALGANVFNMAILGTLPAILCNRFFAAENRLTTKQLAALGFAAWCSVILATAACAVQLAFASSVPLLAFSSSLLGVHALIGVSEAALTVMALALLTSKVTYRSPLVPVLALGLVALLLVPFASSMPDGLQSVMAHFNI